MERHAPVDLLALWELACAPDGALRLLAWARPELPRASLARAPLGHQTLALLDLHERCFGPRLPAQASCPACGESLELELDVPELRAGEPAAADATCLVEHAGYRLHLRLPGAADVAAAARSDEGDPRRHLLARCLLDLTFGDEPCPLARLPDDLIDHAAAAVAAADPHAAIDLALSCSTCGHEFTAALDVLAFLCAELRTHAQRLARQVHTLAAAYGWSEAEILGMSPARRQLYLDLVAA